MAQTLSFNGRRRVRKFFGKIPEVAEMPNLIEVQKASYDQFLMVEEPQGGRHRRRIAGSFQIGVPDFRFFRQRDAGVRVLRVRTSQVRR
jgi:DNA-directed RNA polymerase subunit beta